MSFRDALSHRPFAALVAARAVSRAGDSLHEIALVWLVLQQTGDARLVTLVVVASTLPNVVLALPAGAVADRLDRRRVLVATDLVRGVAVLAIPLLGRGGRLVPVAVGVAVVVGVVEPFAGPARGATLPRTVPDEQLDSANALFSLTSSVSRTLYVLGGGVVAFVGAYPAFYLDSVTFLASAALVATLPRSVGTPGGEASGDGDAGAEPGDAGAEPEDAGADAPDAEDGEADGVLAETQQLLAEAREGLGYVRGTPVVLAILAVGLLVGTLSDPLGIVAPVFVDRTLGRGSFVYGLVFGAIFAGSAAGDLAVSRFSGVIDGARGRFVAGSLAAGGVALAAAGLVAPLSPAPVAATVGAFAAFGVALSLATTPLDTLLQRTVPNEMLGRVSSVFSVVGLVGPPVALAATGPLVEALGADVVLVADGVLVVVAALAVSVPLVDYGRGAVDVVPGD